jgi:hypothetical protein
MDGRYWFVEYYERPSLIHGLGCDHNAIVSSFSEFAALSQGRIGIITGEATAAQYAEAQEHDS